MLIGAALAVALGLVVPPVEASADESGGWPIMPTSAPVVPTPDGVCTVPVPAYPASTAPLPGKRRYIALGDSYAAGEGAPKLVKDSCGNDHDLFITGTQDVGNHCHRSAEAYPVVLAGRLGPDWGLDDRTCSGATTGNFANEQKWDQPSWYEFWKDSPPGNPAQWPSDPASRLPQGKADLITLTMGGNDLGFSDVVATCIPLSNILANNPYSGPPPSCQGQEAAVRGKLPTLGKNLTAALTSMVQDGVTPGGKVLIMGYPHVFPERPPGFCSVGAVLPIPRGDMLWLNGVADLANGVVKQAAKDSKATYVDASHVLTDGGHDGCVNGGGQRWINRSIPQHREWSWHPKAAAHAAEADLLARCLPVAVPGGSCAAPEAAPVPAPDSPGAEAAPVPAPDSPGAGLTPPSVGPGTQSATSTFCPADHPTQLLHGRTDSSEVAICSDGAEMIYVGSSPAGSITLHADRVDAETFEATNVDGGSTYVYRMTPTQLTVTQDGATLSTNPLK